MIKFEEKRPLGENFILQYQVAAIILAVILWKKE